MNWPESELRRALFVERNRLNLAAWIPGERDFVRIRDDKQELRGTERRTGGLDAQMRGDFSGFRAKRGSPAGVKG